MKKKQSKQNRNQSGNQKLSNDSMTLGDRVNQEILTQLRERQKELSEEERIKKEVEAAKKAEERKLREKNKTFEELLNENGPADWTKYK